jgi:hypothetical protein
MCMGLKVFVSLLCLAVVGCTYEQEDPLATFSFTPGTDGSITARKALHSIAISNGLNFEDASQRFPSGTALTSAQVTRPDGLQISLTGTSDMQSLLVAVYCEDKCREWETIFNQTKSEFKLSFAIIEE